MVLADVASPVPRPTCVVRLLATRDGHVLTVPRGDGTGLDIPSVRVAAQSVDECLQELTVRALGKPRPATMLGHVRNAVTQPSEGYPWPVPDAYFSVFHCEVPSDSEGHGEWLAPSAARAQLHARHWWPLAAHVLGLAY